MGVITVSLFLVLILFWLDVYYQNLLYGSVLRTRFLEICRLKYRLSIYISGVYTGSGLAKSGMATILYLIYAGFLIGVFILGIIVASIPLSTEGPKLNTQNSPTQSASVTALKKNVSGLLVSVFILCGLGMTVIGAVSIRTRDKKLTGIANKINDAIFILQKDNKGKVVKILDYKAVSDKDIDDLEIDILNEFTPKV